MKRRRIIALACLSFTSHHSLAASLSAGAGHSSNVYGNPESHGPIEEAYYYLIQSSFSQELKGFHFSNESSAQVHVDEPDARNWKTKWNLSKLKMEDAGHQLSYAFSYALQNTPTTFKEQDPLHRFSAEMQVLRAGEKSDNIFSLQSFHEDHFFKARSNLSPISAENPLFEDDHWGVSGKYENRFYLDEMGEKYSSLQLATLYRHYDDRFARLTNGAVDATRAGEKSRYLDSQMALAYVSEKAPLNWNIGYTLGRDIDFAFKAEDRWKHTMTLGFVYALNKFSLGGNSFVAYSSYDNWLIDDDGVQEKLQTTDWGISSQMKWKLEATTEISSHYSYTKSESKFESDEKSIHDISLQIKYTF